MNKLKEDAIQFLSHPDVIHMSDETKRDFLRSKGFSPEEIDEVIATAVQKKREDSGETSFTRKVLMVGCVLFAGFKAAKVLMNWLVTENETSDAGSPEAQGSRERAEIDVKTETDATRKIDELSSRIREQESKIRSLETSVASIQKLHQSVEDIKVQIESLKTAFLSKKNFSMPQYIRPAQTLGSGECSTKDSSPPGQHDPAGPSSTQESVPQWQLEPPADAAADADADADADAVADADADAKNAKAPESPVVTENGSNSTHASG